MPLRRDEAVVLARYPFRERDLTLALLTREGGLVRALVRRARGGRGGLSAAVEPLASIRIAYFESRRSELATLDEVELVRSPFELASRPASWAAGQVVAELALLFCAPRQRQEASFRLVEHCLVSLAAGAAPRLVAGYAELWFLRLAGVLPELDRCAVCERPLGGEPAAFDRESSHVVCATHALPGTARLTPAALAWLREALGRAVSEVEHDLPADGAAWLSSLRREFTERDLVSLGFLDRLTRDQGAG